MNTHFDALKAAMTLRNRLVASTRPVRLVTALASVLVLATNVVATNAFADEPVITQYTYNPGDNLTAVTDSRGLITSYAYDGLGQLWQLHSPDTGTTNYNYDSYGRVANMTRNDGTQTIYGYDVLNRQTSRTVGGKTQSYIYDTCTNGLDRLCSTSDASGETSYSYTPEGWLAGRGFTIASTTYALGYGYDAMGRVATVVYPDGNQAKYSYSNGVVSAVNLQIGQSNLSVASGITYRPGDTAMSSWTAGNGLTSSLSYDSDSRLESISVPGIQGLTFAYDNADRITSISNQINPDLTQTYAYDDMSRLSFISSGLDSETIQYDSNGNRVAQTLNGASITFDVDENSNRLLSQAGAKVVQYGYDAVGNLTTLSSVPSYHYDGFNRMDSAGATSYYVNPEGQRLAKTVMGQVSYFAPNVSGSMMAENNNGSWSDYIWLNGRPIGKIDSGNVYAVHSDQLGRPESMTDISGAVVWRANNLAFGRQVAQSANAPLNLGFPGQYYDGETGIWNNGFRDYDEDTGRYIESDPSGLAGGTNTYAYAMDNPVQGYDLTGLGTIALGPTLSVTFFAKFDISLQVSFSWNADKLSDLSQYRVGGVFSVSPFTQGSTGVGVSAGVVGTYSSANAPEIFNGWSGLTGGSVGEGAQGGFDVGNIGSGCKTYNLWLGAGVVSTDIFFPGELHAGAGWTAAGSFSL